MVVAMKNTNNNPEAATGNEVGGSVIVWFGSLPDKMGPPLQRVHGTAVFPNGGELEAAYCALKSGQYALSVDGLAPLEAGDTIQFRPAEGGHPCPHCGQRVADTLSFKVSCVGMLDFRVSDVHFG